MKDASHQPPRHIGYMMDEGRYVMTRDGNPVKLIGPTVAVAYTIERSPGGQPDFESVVMHKHGAPEAVKVWAEKTRQAQAALPDALRNGMGNLGNVEILEGPIPIVDLHGFIDSSGYLGVFLKKMSQAAEVASGDLPVAHVDQGFTDVAWRQVDSGAAVAGGGDRGGPRPGSGGSTAFEITEDDVANVIASNELAPDRLQSSPAELAALLHSQLDFGAIEDAALMGDDMDEQTDLAHDEIASQLRRMGVLLPVEAPAEAAEDAHECVIRERAK